MQQEYSHMSLMPCTDEHRIVICPRRIREAVFIVLPSTNLLVSGAYPQSFFLCLHHVRRNGSSNQLRHSLILVHLIKDSKFLSFKQPMPSEVVDVPDRHYCL